MVSANFTNMKCQVWSIFVPVPSHNSCHVLFAGKTIQSLQAEALLIYANKFLYFVSYFLLENTIAPYLKWHQQYLIQTPFLSYNILSIPELTEVFQEIWDRIIERIDRIIEIIENLHDFLKIAQQP